MESCVRGFRVIAKSIRPYSHKVTFCNNPSFHVYQDIWTPTTGERLSCQTEDSNAFDLYAVAITSRKSANVIGHVYWKISAACSLFIQRGGTLTCIIIDSRRQYSSDYHKEVQVPCKLEFKCDNADQHSCYQISRSL